MPPFPRHFWGRGVTFGAAQTRRGKREVGTDHRWPLPHRGQHVGETMLQWPEVPVPETATGLCHCTKYNLCDDISHYHLSKCSR